MKGEVDAPDCVNAFFKILYTGGLLSRKERFVISTSAEVVFPSSGGKLLSGKHIFLREALKSVTDSKLVVNLLSRLGCWSSNEKVWRIDIRMDSSLTSSNSLDLDPDQGYTQHKHGTNLMWTWRPSLKLILFTLHMEFAIKIYHQQYKFFKKLMKPCAIREK